MNEPANPGQQPAEPEPQSRRSDTQEQYDQRLLWADPLPAASADPKSPSSWSDAISKSFGDQQPAGPAPLAQPESESLRSAPDGSVQVRMVWNGWTGGIERVRKWNAGTQSYNSVRPNGTLAEAVRQAFAHSLAEDIVAAAWPGPSTSTGPPARSAELLTVAEELLDPRLLAAKLVKVIVQAAAVHAGISLPLARVMGQAAEKWFVSLSSPEPDAREVRYVDLAFSAEDGTLLNEPALNEIAVDETADAIDRLLAQVDERPFTIPVTPSPVDEGPSDIADPRSLGLGGMG